MSTESTREVRQRPDRRLPVGPSGEVLTEAMLHDLNAIARSRAVGVMTPSARRSLGDDVAQEVMADFCAYWTRHHVDHPERLVRVMARRRAWKIQLRWEQHRPWPSIFMDDPDDDEDKYGWGHKEQLDLAEAQHDPLVAVENRDALRWAIGELRPGYRVIAELAFMAEPRLDAKQIAQELGLSHGTVRNRLVAIRQTLRALFADNGSRQTARSVNAGEPRRNVRRVGRPQQHQPDMADGAPRDSGS